MKSTCLNDMNLWDVFIDIIIIQMSVYPLDHLWLWEWALLIVINYLSYSAIGGNN